jgi:hypothetical protein
MSDTYIDESNPPNPPKEGEYGDVLSDVLNDQVRRNELRNNAVSGPPRRARLHPVVPPILALVSIWLWAFPPSVLRPEPPTIPVANQEAGLRMEMYIQVNKIQGYVSEHGRLPKNLEEVGDASSAVRYEALTASVFRLNGQTGAVMVAYTSTDPVEVLLADAQTIVSGAGSPTSREGLAK